ncbi:InlB B-repeat-containing protein [Bifidobacterium sp. ESL0798]|uniref:InlB B-repeat-containing protein n=1 Tax=Bifidobacterium sp. ESL0798 TaxID=2983235 RepID=UPI0023F92274|nr:InlB B-repeat-containing protein [Bifidobacterium sp. ESL0798]WEV73967.1 InlB B-repeat-containing protein [Bifidobacterium sp. ESL0798]
MQNLPHLRSLTVGFGNVYNLQPLAGLSELSDLTLRYNHVDNVAPLASDAGLKNIDMTGNNVHDVSPLAGLHGLQSLNLDRNHVDDLRPLSGLSNLSNASFSPEGINRPDAASPDNVSLESAVAADGSHVTPTAMVPATGVYDPATGTVNWDHVDDSHKVSLQFKQNVRVGGANAAFSGSVERAVPGTNDSHQNNQDHQNQNQNQNHGDQNQNHGDQNHGDQNHGDQNQNHGNQNHGNQDHQNHQGNHSNPSVTRTYRVQFDSERGSRVFDQWVSAGQTASEPQAPTRRGYTFVGWQYNHKTYDFSTPVTHDIQLRAQWARN